MERAGSHFNRDPRLTSQVGEGPWNVPENGNWMYDSAPDVKRLKRQGFKEYIAVRLPRKSAESVVYRDFVQIPNLATYFFETEYKYDLYTTTDIVDRALTISRNPKQKEIMNTLNTTEMLPWETVVIDDPFSLSKCLGRIRGDALEFPNEGSAEAMALLHNLAKNKKRIAVIDAHGKVTVDENNERKLKILNENKGHTDANVLIKDLANELGAMLTRRYSAIYINSCNLERASRSHALVEPTRIPVVIHKDIHYGRQTVAPVQICWPD